MALPKTIFLTGFPGFIAGRLVERLARDDARFYLLVQKNFVDQALKDCEHIAEITGAPLENFALIEGDITREGLGISPEDLETLQSEVTDLYHLAAAYDLAVPKSVAFAVNLEGTKNVNKLAESLPGLKRYNYISTCYVAGMREGLIYESELEHTAGFRNYYEETKYLAEMEVERLKERLPVTIYRPAVVVGDSRTGEIPKYDGIYYLINYLLKAPNALRLINVGNKDVKLNLVPVDFVIEAIAALAEDEEAVGKTIAIADPAPYATAELFDMIAQELTGKTSAIVPPTGLVKFVLTLPFSPPLTGLPHSGVPYFFISQKYDTSIANGLLAKHNIECPRLKSYIGNLLRYVRGK